MVVIIEKTGLYRRRLIFLLPRDHFGPHSNPEGGAVAPVSGLSTPPNTPQTKEERERYQSEVFTSAGAER